MRTRSLVAIVASTFIVACGDGAEKTLRRLGSSKVDTTKLTSSSGDLRLADTTDADDSTSRRASQFRIRVRDRDALDPNDRMSDDDWPQPTGRFHGRGRGRIRIHY